MADNGSNPWVTIAVAAIGAIGAVGAAMVVNWKPEPKSPVTQPATQTAAQPVADVSSAQTPVGGPPTQPAATPASAPSAAPTGPVRDEAYWRQQVLGYLDTQHKPLMDRGYVRDEGTADWVGLLRVGTPKVWEVQLVRGVEYQVVGVCDEECKDVDMEIYDPSGAKVGGDTLADDAPQVRFAPTSSGAHTVRVWLRTCNAADGSQSCVVAARVLRKG